MRLLKKKMNISDTEGSLRHRRIFVACRISERVSLNILNRLLAYPISILLTLRLLSATLFNRNYFW